jgi:hypothetical protein
MIFNQSANHPQFRSLKTAAGREAARRQPKLAVSIIPLNMNVRRFAGEEKESVGPRPKHRRH